MSIVNFKSENDEYRAEITGKTNHVDYELIRYADGSVDLLTGDEMRDYHASNPWVVQQEPQPE